MIIFFNLALFLSALICISSACIIIRYDVRKVNLTKKEENIHEGYIKTSSGQIFFKIAGADRENTPLLLLHGGPGACHDYFEPLIALSDERPVIFYDQLGCGNSDKPDDMSLYSVENYVKEVGEVRDALGLSEVYILGQSWGGGLMAAYASSKGADGIKGLIFSSPLISTDKWIFDQKSYLSELPEYIQKSVRIAEETGVYDSADYKKAMDEYYRLHICRLSPWPQILVESFEKTSIAVYMHMWGPSEFTCTGTLKSFDMTKNLKTISQPALFLCGEYDEAKPQTMKYFKNILPGSKLAIINDASHMTHLEKTDESLGILRKFMRACD